MESRCSDMIPITTPPVFPNCVKWSEENLLAVSTGHIINILNPALLSGPRGYVSCSHGEILDIGKVKLEDLHAPSLLPTRLSKEDKVLIRCADWSPQGCSPSGGCLLAVCTSDHQLKVYRSPHLELRAEWVEVLDLGQVYFKHCGASCFEEAKPLASVYEKDELLLPPEVEWVQSSPKEKTSCKKPDPKSNKTGEDRPRRGGRRRKQEEAPRTPAVASLAPASEGEKERTVVRGACSFDQLRALTSRPLALLRSTPLVAAVNQIRAQNEGGKGIMSMPGTDKFGASGLAADRVARLTGSFWGADALGKGGKGIRRGAQVEVLRKEGDDDGECWVVGEVLRVCNDHVLVHYKEARGVTDGQPVNEEWVKLEASGVDNQEQSGGRGRGRGRGRRGGRGGRRGRGGRGGRGGGEQRGRHMANVYGRFGPRPHVRLVRPSTDSDVERRHDFVKGDHVEAHVADAWWEGTVKGVRRDGLTVMLWANGASCLVRRNDLRFAYEWNDEEWVMWDREAAKEKKAAEARRRKELANAKRQRLEIEKQSGGVDASGRLGKDSERVDDAEGNGRTAVGDGREANSAGENGDDEGASEKMQTDKGEEGSGGDGWKSKALPLPPLDQTGECVYGPAENAFISLYVSMFMKKYELVPPQQEDKTWDIIDEEIAMEVEREIIDQHGGAMTGLTLPLEQLTREAKKCIRESLHLPHHTAEPSSCPQLVPTEGSCGGLDLGGFDGAVGQSDMEVTADRGKDGVPGGLGTSERAEISEVRNTGTMGVCPGQEIGAAETLCSGDAGVAGVHGGDPGARQGGRADEPRGKVTREHEQAEGGLQEEGMVSTAEDGLHGRDGCCAAVELEASCSDGRKGTEERATVDMLQHWSTQTSREEDAGKSCADGSGLMQTGAEGGDWSGLEGEEGSAPSTGQDLVQETRELHMQAADAGTLKRSMDVKHQEMDIEETGEGGERRREAGDAIGEGQEIGQEGEHQPGGGAARCEDEMAPSAGDADRGHDQRFKAEAAGVSEDRDGTEEADKLDRTVDMQEATDPGDAATDTGDVAADPGDVATDHGDVEIRVSGKGGGLDGRNIEKRKKSTEEDNDKPDRSGGRPRRRAAMTPRKETMLASVGTGREDREGTDGSKKKRARVEVDVSVEERAGGGEAGRQSRERVCVEEDDEEEGDEEEDDEESDPAYEDESGKRDADCGSDSGDELMGSGKSTRTPRKSRKSSRLRDDENDVEVEESAAKDKGKKAAAREKGPTLRGRKTPLALGDGTIAAAEYQARMDLMGALLVAWSPVYRGNASGRVWREEDGSGQSGKEGARACVFLAVAGKAGRVVLWRLRLPSYSLSREACLHFPEFSLVCSFLVHSSWVSALCWKKVVIEHHRTIAGEGGNRRERELLLLVTGSSDGSVRLWYRDAEDLASIPQYDKCAAMYLLGEICPADDLNVSSLAVGVCSGNAGSGKVEDGHHDWQHEGGGIALPSIAIAVGKGAGDLFVCHGTVTQSDEGDAFVRKQTFCRPAAHEQMITGLAWTENCIQLYSCGQDNQLKCWKYEGYKLHRHELPDVSCLPGAQAQNMSTTVEVVTDAMDNYYGIAMSPNCLAMATVRGMSSELLNRMYERRQQQGVLQIFWISGVDNKPCPLETAGGNMQLCVSTSKNDLTRDAVLLAWKQSILQSMRNLAPSDKPIVLWDIIGAIQYAGDLGVSMLAQDVVSAWEEELPKVYPVHGTDTVQDDKRSLEASADVKARRMACRAHQMTIGLCRKLCSTHRGKTRMRRRKSQSAAERERDQEREREREREYDCEFSRDAEREALAERERETVRVWETSVEAHEHVLRESLVYTLLAAACQLKEGLSDCDVEQRKVAFGSNQGSKRVTVSETSALLMADWISHNAPYVWPSLLEAAARVYHLYGTLPPACLPSTIRESCPLCQAPVPWQSHDMAKCMNASGEETPLRSSLVSCSNRGSGAGSAATLGQAAHKLHRCMVSMELCMSPRVWRCSCCSRRASAPVPPPFLTYAISPKLTSERSLVEDRTRGGHANLAEELYSSLVLSFPSTSETLDCLCSYDAVGQYFISCPIGNYFVSWYHYYEKAALGHVCHGVMMRLLHGERTSGQTDRQAVIMVLLRARRSVLDALLSVRLPAVAAPIRSVYPVSQRRCPLGTETSGCRLLSMMPHDDASFSVDSNTPWLVCKVYVSEGRNQDVLDHLQDGLSPSKGPACLVHVFPDEPFNRTGFTIAGHSGFLERMVVTLASRAISSIDLRKQEALHPRLGSVDHISVHPLGPLTEERRVAAAQAARNIAMEIGTDLNIPTYLYGWAHPGHRPLDELRRSLGFFAGASSGKWKGHSFPPLLPLPFSPLPSHSSQPQTQSSRLQTQSSRTQTSITSIAAQVPLPPDYGPSSAAGPAALVSAAGVTVVGACPWMINFNVPILTQDMKLCQQIAKAVSARGGGLPHVQAMALRHGSGCLEVACNLLDPVVSGPEAVQSRVQQIASQISAECKTAVLEGYLTGPSIDGIKLVLENHLSELRQFSDK
ncbi:hypothetical protein CBR_g20108 [Chara braunii]|uniref:glutamate formimidoyltransferase n=1 Tax=Chara braunii TaxID=69332 RepID=A0A388KZJ0_CHABU|nr:hypothetical protein CBR_g20108 [Chara braunii]|eukprot:GBG75477.1 hypothetical protein CBR_g20108 [Chara braunii]